MTLTLVQLTSTTPQEAGRLLAQEALRPMEAKQADLLDELSAAWGAARQQAGQAWDWATEPGHAGRRGTIIGTAIGGTAGLASSLPGILRRYRQEKEKRRSPAKQADWESVKQQLGQAWNQHAQPLVDSVSGKVREWAQPVVDSAIGKKLQEGWNQVKGEPAFQYGLAGAGLGGAMGLGAGLLTRRRKSRALGDALTGALLGGGVGAAGGHLGSQLLNKLNEPPPPPPPPPPSAAQSIKMQIDEQLGKDVNPELKQDLTRRGLYTGGAAAASLAATQGPRAALSLADRVLQNRQGQLTSRLADAYLKGSLPREQLAAAANNRAFRNLVQTHGGNPALLNRQMDDATRRSLSRIHELYGGTIGRSIIPLPSRSSLVGSALGGEAGAAPGLLKKTQMPGLGSRWARWPLWLIPQAIAQYYATPPYEPAPIPAPTPTP